ncbi:MAG: hypothetical protein RML37_04570 [Chitinophagales bacterium]|nr:hypothetical protein [Chitinophagales bacterium]
MGIDPGYWTSIRGDAVTYLRLSENLYEHGTYSNDEKPPYTPSIYRLPGMAIIYLPLRIFFSKEGAVNAFLILQVFALAVSKFAAGRILYHKTNSAVAYVFFILLVSFNYPLSRFQNRFLPECFSTAFLTLSIWCLFHYARNLKMNFLFFSGLFYALALFLRPYLGVFIPLYFYYIYKADRKPINFSTILNRFTLFLSVALVIETCWVVRNFLSLKKFEPFDGTMFCTMNVPPYCEIRKLIAGFGGDYTYWTKNSHGRWFAKYLVNDSTEIPVTIFPNHLFTEGLTVDSLILARELGFKPFNPQTMDSAVYLANVEHSRQILVRFRKALKKNHPLRYYLEGRLRYLFKGIFPVGGGVYHLNVPLPRLDLIKTFFHVFLNSGTILSIGVGFLSSVIIFFYYLKKPDKDWLVLSLFCILSYMLTYIYFVSVEVRQTWQVSLLLPMFTSFVFTTDIILRHKVLRLCILTLIIIVAVIVSLLQSMPALSQIVMSKLV